MAHHHGEFTTARQEIVDGCELIWREKRHFRFPENVARHTELLLAINTLDRPKLRSMLKVGDFKAKQIEELRVRRGNIQHLGEMLRILKPQRLTDLMLHDSKPPSPPHELRNQHSCSLSTGLPFVDTDFPRLSATIRPTSAAILHSTPPQKSSVDQSSDYNTLPITVSAAPAASTCTAYKAGIGLRGSDPGPGPEGPSDPVHQ